jgi:hypothetical protein
MDLQTNVFATPTTTSAVLLPSIRGCKFYTEGQCSLLRFVNRVIPAKKAARTSSSRLSPPGGRSEVAIVIRRIKILCLPDLTRARGPQARWSAAILPGPDLICKRDDLTRKGQVELAHVAKLEWQEIPSGARCGFRRRTAAVLGLWLSRRVRSQADRREGRADKNADDDPTPMGLKSATLRTFGGLAGCMDGSDDHQEWSHSHIALPFNEFVVSKHSFCTTTLLAKSAPLSGKASPDTVIQIHEFLY